PYAAVLLAIVVFAILHAGKSPMRERYWQRKLTVVPAEYPNFYGRWVSFGLDRIRGKPVETVGRRRRHTEVQANVLDRSSIVQILLLVQKKSPTEKPFLYGETYAIIPELLVPRALYEDKPRSHEGTYMLAIHYGLQNRKATRSTTIGFGLLAEAYANFAMPGVVGLAIFLGVGLALATRWSMHLPITSFQGLFAMMVLGLLVRTEHSAGVAISSLFQGTVVLFCFGIMLMKPLPLGATQVIPRVARVPVVPCAV